MLVKMTVDDFIGQLASASPTPGGGSASALAGAMAAAMVEMVCNLTVGREKFRDVEEEMRLLGSDVSSQDVGLSVLARLEDLDHVAYLRFASVYKGFEDITDFQREVGLLAKATAPKRHV